MKKKAFMVASLATGILAIAATSLVGAKPTSLKGTNVESESYWISFDLTKNKLHGHIDDVAYDGDAIVKTDLGNEIGFKYYKIIGTSNSWHTLGTGGNFYNTDPIHGMESIRLTFNSSDVAYSIYYSGDNGFEQSKSFVSEISSTFSFDFDGCKPNYFKLVNTDTNENLDIASIHISLSCQNNYPTLSLSSSNETMGSVSGGGVKKTGSEVAITATPKEGYRFAGWYKDDGFISKDNPYKFMMPSVDYGLTANFCTEAEYTERYANAPVLSSDSKTIKYGLYPQTIVSDSSLISSLNLLTKQEANGWYFYNGGYYAKATAKPYDSSYIFSNGVTIEKGKDYWFRCEPIEWKVLGNNNGEYFVLSSLLLDSKQYFSSYSKIRTINGNMVWPNNYEYSDIRSWLNGDFYGSAFALGSNNIMTTTVDNSADSTGYSSNEYACKDTDDKVFLLSYREATNFNFSDSDRKAYATDYAKCQFIYVDSSYGSSTWGLRSPDKSSSKSTRFVIPDGKFSNSRVDYFGRCARPAMRISIK